MQIPEIKICGLISEEDIGLVNQYDVAYTGMVLFYEKSKRNISLEKAKHLLRLLRSDIKPVAVTVSPTPEQIREIEAAGFSYLQIHGVLSDEVLQTATLPIFRAFNMADAGQPSLEAGNEKIVAYLFDGKVPGGGKVFDWSLAKDFLAAQSGNKKMILAGGLTASNVADGIRILQPDIVDVSSAVEKDTGSGKDNEKIRLFVKAVQDVANIG